MYYNGKKDFLIKQYGKQVLIIALSLCIVFLGVYTLILEKQINSSNDQIISEIPSLNDNETIETNNAQNNVNTETKEENIEQVTENETQENTEEIVTETKTSEYFDNMENLTLSKKLTVTNITDKKITLEDDTSKITVSLIGISYEHCKIDINTKLSEDLLDNQVRIAFDKSREDNQVYIYLNNELYNAKLLEQGFVTLKSERVNTSLVNTLSTAQKKARDKKIGVWS